MSYYYIYIVCVMRDIRIKFQCKQKVLTFKGWNFQIYVCITFLILEKTRLTTAGPPISVSLSSSENTSQLLFDDCQKTIIKNERYSN